MSSNLACQHVSSTCVVVVHMKKSFTFSHYALSSTVASLMPGMDLSVTTRLTPSPRDMSPALAIALPMMKSVNIVPAQCFDNMAFHGAEDKSDISEKDETFSKRSSRQESLESDNTLRVNNYKNERYMSKGGEEKTDARTPLLRDHKIESLDENKLRESKAEKRKSSAST